VQRLSSRVDRDHTVQRVHICFMCTPEIPCRHAPSPFQNAATDRVRHCQQGLPVHAMAVSPQGRIFSGEPFVGPCSPVEGGQACALSMETGTLPRGARFSCQQPPHTCVLHGPPRCPPPDACPQALPLLNALVLRRRTKCSLVVKAKADCGCVRLLLGARERSGMTPTVLRQL
jgi:hypothetical protein